MAVCEREQINRNYQVLCHNIANELYSGIKEGVREGIKEGVKSGIMDAVSECSALKFLKIKKTGIKKIQEILKDFASEFLEENAYKITTEEIVPTIRKVLKNNCDKTVDMLTKQDITIDSRLLDVTQRFDFRRIADDKIDEFKNTFEKNLPQNFMVKSIYKGIQKASFECLDDDIDRCSKRMNEVLKLKSSLVNEEDKIAGEEDTT